jgi:DNA-binding beta-propeller fold protein YncE
LYTPQSFGIAVDEVAQEIFLTDQQDASVVVWRKSARENDEPIRLLQGDRTGLADPHGLAVDSQNRLLFVANHGDVHRKRRGGRLASSPGGGRSEGKKNWPIGEHIPGSGQSLPPSITIHAIDAQGDTPPLRTIQGDRTQLNWPTGIAFDPKRNEIFVANDGADSILVFSASAGGDVAPLRVLKGPKSLIKNPTGVAIDIKNDELWVANYGNHTATVYSPTANGDVPPLRLIRSSPLNRPALIIGNPGALAYDINREEILAPN